MKRSKKQVAKVPVVANNNSIDTTTPHGNVNPSTSATPDNVLKELSEIRKSQEFVSTEYDETIKELNQCRETNKNFRAEITSLTKKYTELRTEVEFLKSKNNANEQSKINNNVLIRGVDETEPVDVAVMKIAQISEIDLCENDIDFAKQLKFKDKAPSIMVKFSNNNKKYQFVRAAKGKKISTAMYGCSGETRPIYVDEQLTRESFLLFKHAKKLKRIGVSFVWIANGEIYVREKQNAEKINIKTVSQIDAIEREIILRSKATKPSGASANPTKRTDNEQHKRANQTNTNIVRNVHNCMGTACRDTRTLSPRLEKNRERKNTSKITDDDKAKHVATVARDGVGELHQDSVAELQKQLITNTHVERAGMRQTTKASDALSSPTGAIKLNSVLNTGSINGIGPLDVQVESVTNGSSVNMKKKSVNFNPETNVMMVSTVIVESDSDLDTTADYTDA